jgi:putative nucleic acid binding protein
MRTSAPTTRREFSDAMKTLIATLSLICAGCSLFAGEQATRVEATRLYADYEKNTLAADKKYKDRQIAVAGTIDKIDKDLFGNAYARLHVNEWSGVQCNFKPAAVDSLAKAHKGQRYTIAGKVLGKIGNVILVECEFAK